MNRRNSSSNHIYLVVLLIITECFLLASTNYLSWIDDTLFQRRTLDLLTPLQDFLAKQGEFWFTHRIRAYSAFVYFTVGVAFIALANAFIRNKKFLDIYSSLWIPGFLLCLYGRLALLQSNFDIVLPLFAGGVFLALIGFYIADKPKGSDKFKAFSLSEPLTIPEVFLMVGVLLLALFFRFYALNRIPDYFEGELSPYMVGSTTLAGALKANAGFMGPFSPNGIFYYLFYYPFIQMFGTTVLALRLSSASVDICSITIAYIMARHLFGARVAVLFAYLLALDPLLIGWARSDIHPHAATAWPTFLVCLFTYRALKWGKPGDYLLTCISMGLTWHVYPSGQAGFSIALLAAFLNLVVNPSFLKRDFMKLPLLLVGVFFWALGDPLNNFLASGKFEISYLSKIGPRFPAGVSEKTSLDTAYEAMQQLLEHIPILIEGMFLNVPRIFHQTFLPALEDQTFTSLPWICSAAVVVALAKILANCRKEQYVVLAAWLLIAPMPGLLSEYPYLKRAATLFPALNLAAALVLAGFLHAGIWGRKGHFMRFLVVTFAVYLHSSLMNFFWFSGRQFHSDTPKDIPMAQELAADFNSGTLMYFYIEQGYLNGKLRYLLSDALNNETNAPSTILIGNAWEDPKRLLLDSWMSPTHHLDEMSPDVWYYSWTRLAPFAEEHKVFRDWKKIVWVLQTDEQRPEPPRPSLEERIRHIRELCPGVKIESRQYSEDYRHKITVGTCKYSDFRFK